MSDPLTINPTACSQQVPGDPTPGPGLPPDRRRPHHPRRHPRGLLRARPPTHANYADRVLGKKSERKLQFLKQGEVVKEYRVALGDSPRGHKLREGDERTPAGDYVLDCATRAATTTRPSMFPTQRTGRRS